MSYFLTNLLVVLYAVTSHYDFTFQASNYQPRIELILNRFYCPYQTRSLSFVLHYSSVSSWKKRQVAHFSTTSFLLHGLVSSSYLIFHNCQVEQHFELGPSSTTILIDQEYYYFMKYDEVELLWQYSTLFMKWIVVKHPEMCRSQKEDDYLMKATRVHHLLLW